MEDERHLMTAVLAHLTAAAREGKLNSDHLLSACNSISAAFDLDLSDPVTLSRYPLNSLSLPAVYKRGRDVLLAEALDQASDEEEAAFQKFLSRLKSTPFFRGVEPETPEYDARVSRARAKFDARRASKKGTAAELSAEVESAPEVASAPAANKTSSDSTASRSAVDAGGVSEEMRTEAEAIKAEGNALVKSGRYAEAIEAYTKCIALDSQNAVYYSNRAAAKMHLGQLSSAADDCKLSIARDPTFIRARERLASAYRHLGMLSREIAALEAGLADNPGNEKLMSLLADAKERESRAGDGAISGAQQGSRSGLSAAMSAAQSMGLDPGDVQNFLQSPIGAQLGAQMEQMMGGGTGGDGNFDMGEFMARGMEAMQQRNPAMMSMMQEGLRSMANGDENMANMMQRGMEAFMNNPDLAQAALSQMMDEAGMEASGRDSGENEAGR